MHCIIKTILETKLKKNKKKKNTYTQKMDQLMSSAHAHTCRM